MMKPSTITLPANGLSETYNRTAANKGSKSGLSLRRNSTRRPFIPKLVLLLLICLCANHVFAQTNYYVSATVGADTNNGTSTATPFKTIKKAATMARSGGTVFVAEGTYVEESIRPSYSGTADAMIVFKPASPADQVIIKHPATASSSTYVFDLSNRSYIRIEGFHFKDYAYCKSTFMITGGNGISIVNNRFENLGSSDSGPVIINMNRTQLNVIRNNYFKNIYGVAIGIMRETAKSLINENTFIDTNSHAMGVGDEVENADNVIAFNYITNGNSLVWFDRNGSDNIVLRNESHHCSSFIFNESRCARNLIQENIADGATRYAFESAHYNTGWTSDARWINNVAYNCRTGFYLDMAWRNEARNNIVFNSTGYNVEFTAKAAACGPHFFENNLWFTEGKPQSMKFEGTEMSVADFAENMNETGTLSSDPLFENAGGGDFSLKAASPARGKGDNGIDLGAYAVYHKTEVGFDDSVGSGETLVEFSNNSIVSTPKRGETVELTIRLNKPAAAPVSVDVVPVAGDAQKDIDFRLDAPTVTFASGETDKTISIPVVGLGRHEQLVALRLENPAGASVGARNLHAIRIRKTANAGEDMLFKISKSGAKASVSFDASATVDPDNEITSYSWQLADGTKIAVGKQASAQLGMGSYDIYLVAKTAGSPVEYKDVVRVDVIVEKFIWLEMESGKMGDSWAVADDATASNGKVFYITRKEGTPDYSGAPETDAGWVTYPLDIPYDGVYTFWARTICPNASSDSFFLQMDDTLVLLWNGPRHSTTWSWDSYSQPFYYNLKAGKHTFRIGYREKGAKLDSMLFTNGDFQPVDP